MCLAHFAVSLSFVSYEICRHPSALICFSRRVSTAVLCHPRTLSVLDLFFEKLFACRGGRGSHTSEPVVSEKKNDLWPLFKGKGKGGADKTTHPVNRAKTKTRIAKKKGSVTSIDDFFVTLKA
jgi:hypothetical protein